MVKEEIPKKVVRINPDLYKRLAEASRKKGMTITAGAEKGILEFVEGVEYSFENIINQLNLHSLLKLHSNIFLKMFEKIDTFNKEPAKAILNFLKEEQVNFCEANFEEMDKIILEKENCKKALYFLRINLDNEETKTKEFKKNIDGIIKKINESKSNNKLQFLFESSFKEPFKLGIFFIENKEADGDDKK
jgi:hypothetical protein